MDGWLKGLVAVTCLAVLAAVGWWGWSEWLSEGAEVPEQATAYEAEDQARRIRCARQIQAWDSGDRSLVEDEFGQHAEVLVMACRTILDAAPNR